MANTTNPEYWARVLGSGWFISWQVLERSAQQIPEHWQTIRVGKGCIYPSLNFLSWAAAAFPGSVWIVGNEPDVIWQDNVLPEEYAHIYHDAYITLKGADPTAKVAVGAIAQATPLRLAYLDRVLAEYKTSFGSSLPADWWTVHGYVLREEHNSWGVEIPPGFDVKQGVLYEVLDHGQLALFEQQLIIFREWMAGRGYQNTPLALTEFGILMPPSYGFPTEMVTSYLENSFSWLQNTKDPDFGYPADNNRLVQRWAWFSLSYSTYPAPNLADLGKDQLTAIGQSFKNYVMKYKP